MAESIVMVVMRFVHIASAVVAVGGTAFLALCLTPALRLVDDSFRRSVLGLVKRRFHRALALSIAGLVVSGTYNWYMNAAGYRAMGPAGNALIGTKVLLSMILFALIWANANGLLDPARARLWMIVNLHLAAAIILLAGVLRYLSIRQLAGG